MRGVRQRDEETPGEAGDRTHVLEQDVSLVHQRSVHTLD